MVNNNKKASVKQSFLNVMKHIGKYRILLFISLILACATVILTLYAPILFGNAIDFIIQTGNVDFPQIIKLLFKILIVILLTSVLTWVMNIINNKLAYHTVKDIRLKAIRKIQTLPLKFLDSHSTGDIVGRVIADADQLSDGLLLGLNQLFAGLVTIIVTLYFMFSKSVHITLLVILLTPVSFIVARLISKHSYAMFLKQTETRGKQTALIEEMIGNCKLVKAFGYENRASERFNEVNMDLKNYSEKAIFYSSLTNPCTRAVNNTIYALVALLGSYLILNGKLTVGGLSVMLAYANQYTKPFNDISSVITEFQNALACANRIFSLIDEKSEIAEKTNVLPCTSGNADLNHVYFGYEPEHILIKDFDLHVKQGMKIALVGPTGCGKTTMINLLMRFYDVTDGNICIDSVDIRDVTRHSLRQNYGMVLQDTWLKTGTVRENIAFGKPDATDEEIIKAAKETHSWNFIKRLPNGLDTVINEDSLSAGQKQLLCITRIMLALPPMLILDEATSSIDTRTEIEIQKAFDKLMQGRTSFVVAHRLSTIQSADLILVMKDGVIIERGTHESLMAQNGFYTNLYNSQWKNA